MEMTLQKIKLKDKEINYKLRRSKKARRMRLTIYCDGSMVATVPNGSSLDTLEKFIDEKTEWIMRKIEFFKSSYGFIGGMNLAGGNKQEYEKYKNVALEMATARVQYFNHFYNFSFEKIAVRNQKTRWGSCSMNGNLNFNYKIIFLPAELRDYIIVHEICHLGQFNHSIDFWNLVEKTIPDYKKLRSDVRKL